MNLPQIITRLKAACPGWKVPENLRVPSPRLVSEWVKDEFGGTANIPDSQAAAIILASVKEWCEENRVEWQTRMHRWAGVTEYSSRIGGGPPCTFPTELEALTAALEAAKESN